LSALDDQRVAGVLMWVPGSVAFLLPMFWIGIRLLYGPSTSGRQQRAARPGTVRASDRLLALPVISTFRPASELAQRRALAGRHAVAGRRYDLLRVPIVHGLLQWRHARLAAQLLMGLLAGMVIWDGLVGPQAGALNLAGVLPWIHWRGLLVFSLLVAGNLFCFACPFTLPRSVARRWLPARFEWPQRLRSKWLAVVLLLLFFWTYEAFALWDSPWWTAWIAIAYFVASLAVDGLFRGAAFCKYVCPIGQFNFVQSLVSPLSVQVREPAACASCRTRECIQGGGGIPGCELELFQPRKHGNMDCTFCLDCVHACPHDNVGLIAGLPGRELWSDPLRSGIGRFSRRPDLAALVAVIVFAAFANAAGMVGPIVQWENRLQAWLGWHSPFWVIGLLLLVGLVVVPLVAIAGSAALSCRLGDLRESWTGVATRYVYALVPLGCAMWIAHYSFHFLTSCAAVVPVAQRFAGDHGISLGTSVNWQAACCQPVGDWLPRLEILLLDAGLLLSLYTGFRIALADQAAQGARSSAAWNAFAPWGLLTVLLFASGVWIVLQPMQMRGTNADDGAVQIAEVEP
jgi:ferredoxin